ncbi:MAG: hypothetical protein KQ78_01390 [Candidatus Izimaplasma bacterium HR2]|nr:MAG: hypothetical protein KQ78_01390 [Candidatus Izimaplasma bacterium HR2]
MAKRIVYAKGYNGLSDFVYVDLLPDVKRSRQFNMNVIITLTFTVVLAFVFIYMPFRTATEEFEVLNGLNNDLKHELLLTNEELIGYEINLETITFEQQIELLVVYKVDFNNLLDDLQILVDLKNINYSTTLTEIYYYADLSSFEITIISTSNDIFNHLNNDFLNLNWVATSSYSQPEQLQDAVLWRSTFTIGVDRDAE